MKEKRDGTHGALSIVSYYKQRNRRSYPQHIAVCVLKLKRDRIAVEDVIGLVGECFMEAASCYHEKGSSIIVTDKNSIGVWEKIKHLIKNEAIVLVKGSRGMRMDLIVEQLREIED